MLSIVNADSENASLKEKWVTGTSSVVSKKVSALIQVKKELLSRIVIQIFFFFGGQTSICVYGMVLKVGGMQD